MRISKATEVGALLHNANFLAFRRLGVFTHSAARFHFLSCQGCVVYLQSPNVHCTDRYGRHNNRLREREHPYVQFISVGLKGIDTRFRLVCCAYLNFLIQDLDYIRGKYFRLKSQFPSFYAIYQIHSIHSELEITANFNQSVDTDSTKNILRKDAILIQPRRSTSAFC